MDQLNCGGCSQVFPVSAISQYIQHKAGGLCGSQEKSVRPLGSGQCDPEERSGRPLGSPTISGSDQSTGDRETGSGMMSYYEFCFK